MVPQRVPVRVTLVADVALRLLSLVRVFVHSGSRAVVEPRRTPITKVSSVEIGVVTCVTLRRSSSGLFNVRRHGVSRNVKPKMSSQVLTIAKTFQTSQTDQSFCLVVVQLLLGQRKSVLDGHEWCPLLVRKAGFPVAASG